MQNARDIVKKLKEIERKNGHLFRMSIGYLLNKGHENMKGIDLKEAEVLLQKQDDEITSKGHMPVMTVDFQIALIKLAKEIAAEFPLWDILGYIKEEVGIYGYEEVKRYKVLLQSAITMWNEDGMMAYGDDDEWKEHVIESLELDDDEYESIYSI